MENILQAFKILWSVLKNLVGFIGKYHRKSRTEQANHEWIVCLIELICFHMQPTTDLLFQIKSGIAERNNIYMSEMLPTLSALHQAYSIVLNNPEYDNGSKKSFCLYYPIFWLIAKNIGTSFEADEQNIRIVNRKLTFFTSFSVIAILLIGYNIKKFFSYENWIGWDNILSNLFLFFIITIVAASYTYLFEILFPPKVKYFDQSCKKNIINIRE